MKQSPQKDKSNSKTQPLPSRPERGRPAKFLANEKWDRTTIVLRHWEIAFLDRLAADIREKTGCVLNRSDLIRELISVLLVYREQGNLPIERIQERKDLAGLLLAMMKL